jgi:hypothetical protein
MRGCQNITLIFKVTSSPAVPVPKCWCPQCHGMACNRASKTSSCWRLVALHGGRSALGKTVLTSTWRLTEVASQHWQGVPFKAASGPCLKLIEPSGRHGILILDNHFWTLGGLRLKYLRRNKSAERTTLMSELGTTQAGHKKCRAHVVRHCYWSWQDSHQGCAGHRQ